LLRVIINGDSAEATTSGAEKCEKTFAVGYKCALVPGSISCEKYALNLIEFEMELGFRKRVQIFV